LNRLLEAFLQIIEVELAQPLLDARNRRRRLSLDLAHLIVHALVKPGLLDELHGDGRNLGLNDRLHGVNVSVKGILHLPKLVGEHNVNLPDLALNNFLDALHLTHSSFNTLSQIT